MHKEHVFMFMFLVPHEMPLTFKRMGRCAVYLSEVFCSH